MFRVLATDWLQIATVWLTLRARFFPPSSPAYLLHAVTARPTR